MTGRDNDGEPIVMERDHDKDVVFYYFSAAPLTFPLKFEMKIGESLRTLVISGSKAR